MDLFRRFFGKTSDEMPSEDNIPEKQEEDLGKTAEVDAVDADDTLPDRRPTGMTEDDVLSDIDSSTRPVGMPPPTNTAQSRLSAADGVTQPLNPEVLIANINSRLTFGQSTDVGLVRNNNQDAVLSFFSTSGTVEDNPDFGLFVVADGMGGHHDGEKASSITVRTMALHVTSSILTPMISGKDAGDLPPITEALIDGVQKSNQEVLDNVPDGGTTLTAIAVVGDLAYVAHVGDSRAYLITKESVEQITRDHSLVQRLIELDQLTQEEAETHPQKNVLYRALGQNESLEVDTLTRRLPSGSRVLICSDGLWGQMTEQEIYDIAMGHQDPQEACDKLVALANTHGGVDNITAIILKVS
jgi:PPM family protein phosphatase